MKGALVVLIVIIFALYGDINPTTEYVRRATLINNSLSSLYNESSYTVYLGSLGNEIDYCIHWNDFEYQEGDEAVISLIDSSVNVTYATMRSEGQHSGFLFIGFANQKTIMLDLHDVYEFMIEEHYMTDEEIQEWKNSRYQPEE